MSDQKLRLLPGDPIPRPRPIHKEDGWTVVALPTITARPRVAIVDQGRTKYMPVWRDCWREALAAIIAGDPPSQDHIAPSYGF